MNCRIGQCVWKHLLPVNSSIIVLKLYKCPIIILNYLKLSNRNMHLSIVAMAVDGNANKRHTAHQAIPFTL